MNERELKFRIWVHIDKAFTYFDVYDYPSGIAFGVSYPMQFTGILDSKGVEIYEGDILQFYNYSYDNLFIAEIKYVKGSFVCYNKTFEVYPILGGYGVPYKIIGNIIEHKHLLA